jgi:hypothetical protein
MDGNSLLNWSVYIKVFMDFFKFLGCIIIFFGDENKLQSKKEGIMTSKVYKHKKLARDQYLGRVEADGKVYEGRYGKDKYVGRVDLENGNIYESRLGPDQLLGRVELDSGKVYFGRMGPDQYLGRVHQNGRLYLHKRLARDEYLGRIKDMPSFAHGGAAFLLLVLPAHEQEAQEIASKAQAEQKKGGEHQPI